MSLRLFIFWSRSRKSRLDFLAIKLKRTTHILRPASGIMVLIKNSKTGKKIEALSTLKKEKEIIFKSNTEFIVEKVSIGTNPDTLEPIKTVILKEK